MYIKKLISTIALGTFLLWAGHPDTMRSNKHAIIITPPITPPIPSVKTDSVYGVQSPSFSKTKTEEQTKLKAIAGEHTSTPASNISIHLKTGKTTGRSYKSWRI